MDGQSFYFQTIARKFFELRGAPFFLSSNELSLIEKWEAAGIPLRVVLEGIKSSFSTRRQKQGGRTGLRGKIRSLSFCDTRVKEAFSLYKERTVGRTPSSVLRPDKKKTIHRAVAQFLDRVPRQVDWLETPFVHVKKMVLDCSEEDLERAEENIESIMAANASPEDQEEAKKEAAAAFPDLAGKEDFQRVFYTTLIKLMRGKYKIPHVAPFMY